MSCEAGKFWIIWNNEWPYIPEDGVEFADDNCRISDRQLIPYPIVIAVDINRQNAKRPSETAVELDGDTLLIRKGRRECLYTLAEFPCGFDGRAFSLTHDASGEVYSVFLARLVSLQRRVQAAGGALRLADLSPEAKEIFTVCHLDRLFEFAPTTAAAVAELQPA